MVPNKNTQNNIMSSARIVILLYMPFDTKQNHGDWVVP
jgi:hypothetical protein